MQLLIIYFSRNLEMLILCQLQHFEFFLRNNKPDLEGGCLHVKPHGNQDFFCTATQSEQQFKAMSLSQPYR